MSYYVYLELPLEKRPRCREIWERLVARDPELKVATREGETLVMIEWQPAEGLGDYGESEPELIAVEGHRLAMKYPSGAAFGKLAHIARHLGAKIEGEDGERFSIKEHLDAYPPGSPGIEDPPPKPPKRAAAPAEPVAYSMKTKFAEGQLLDHQKFGRGKVARVEAGKIVVKFEDGSQRLLAHGG